MSHMKWPGRPIVVNPVESLIECFWIPGMDAARRWKVRPHGGARDARLRHFWDATFLEFDSGRVGAGVSIRRDYALDLGSSDRMLVRLRTGEGARVSLFATIDGTRRRIVEDTPGSNEEQEIGGTFGTAGSGGTLEGIELRVSSDVPGPRSVMLRWVLLGRPGERWVKPLRPFEGMIRETGKARFEPGLGLIWGSRELSRMRRIHTSPELARMWERDQRLAARQYRVDPAKSLRQYALYAPSRYGRPWDLKVDLGTDALLMALVGLLTRNAEYLRQAARHAVVLARMEHWSEGFVDRTSELQWYHSGFAPNVATIKASLLLDWTWNWLTPAGRKLVRTAIRRKGLPSIERAKEAMANQGIRFNLGRILGHMAMVDDWSSRALQSKVRSSLRIINEKMDAVIRPDGTFSEGMGYGKGTTAATFLSYVAASRCLDTVVRDLASPRILPALRFVLDAERAIASVFAAFAAGPLSDESFSPDCRPTYLLQGETAAKRESCEFVYYGLPNLWAPELRNGGRRAKPTAFKVYRDGGWVFMGSKAAGTPRVTLESGLWDGLGHAWLHKNAVTMSAWGKPLLLARRHVGYQDARSEYTMSTKLNNTFSPGERNQDASGTPGCGGKLLVAEDLGHVAVVESDNATAWGKGVRKALRRVVYIRPYVIVVEDVGQFTTDETGVQSWNSLAPWRVVNDHCVRTSLGGVGVRLTCLTPEDVTLTAGEDSVHRDPVTSRVVPAYRAAFTHASARAHHLITLIEIVPPKGKGSRSRVKVLDRSIPMIEIRQGDVTTRVAAGGSEMPHDTLWGCSTDGELGVAVREGGELSAVASSGATRITTPRGGCTGEGFVSWYRNHAHHASLSSEHVTMGLSVEQLRD